MWKKQGGGLITFGLVIFVLLAMLTIYLPNQADFSIVAVSNQYVEREMTHEIEKRFLTSQQTVSSDPTPYLRPTQYITEVKSFFLKNGGEDVAQVSIACNYFCVRSDLYIETVQAAVSSTRPGDVFFWRFHSFQDESRSMSIELVCTRGTSHRSIWWDLAFGEHGLTISIREEDMSGNDLPEDKKTLITVFSPRFYSSVQGGLLYSETYVRP